MSLLTKSFVRQCCKRLQQHYACSCLGLRKQGDLGDLLASSRTFD